MQYISLCFSILMLYTTLLKKSIAFERKKAGTTQNESACPYGYAVSKLLPYGLYTVHQTKTVNDAAFVPDFQVQISENKKTYEYVLNNAPFTSYLYITKIDAESGYDTAIIF